MKNKEESISDEDNFQASSKTIDQINEDFDETPKYFIKWSSKGVITLDDDRTGYKNEWVHDKTSDEGEWLPWKFW